MSADENASFNGDFAAGGTVSDGVEVDDPTAEDSESDGVEFSGMKPELWAAGGFGGRECDIVLCLECSQSLALLGVCSLQSSTIGLEH